MDIDRDPAFLRHFIKEELYIINEVKQEIAPLPAKSAVDETSAVDKKEGEVFAEKAGKQGLLIIIKSDFQDLAASQKELLQKILVAVKVDMAAAKLISEAAYKQLPEAVENYRQVLSFGVDLPNATSRYQLLKKGDQQVLVSDSLAALEQAIALKGKLWAAMQQMFGT